MTEQELPGTPAVEFIERGGIVPPDCYAVTDGETWGVYPKKYCRNARIVKCSRCGAPATHIDVFFSAFSDGNLCDECNQDKELEDE